MTGAPASRRVFLERMSRRYCWDALHPAALANERRIVRRVMDLGVIDDLLELEDVIGRDELVATLESAPPGSLRPRAWHFWHYRLPPDGSWGQAAAHARAPVRMTRYDILPSEQREILPSLAPTRDLDALNNDDRHTLTDAVSAFSRPTPTSRLSDRLVNDIGEAKGGRS